MPSKKKRNLLLRLEEILRILQRVLRKTTAEKGLTAPQFGFLRLLQENPSASLSELAAMTGVGASSISGTITRLENLNLIERERSQDDRRLVEICITQKGDALISEVLDARLNALELFYQHLSLAELESMVAALESQTNVNRDEISGKASTKL